MWIIVDNAFDLFVIDIYNMVTHKKDAIIIKPGFHLQQTPRPEHKNQSDYVVEQSSFTLIALF